MRRLILGSALLAFALAPAAAQDVAQFTGRWGFLSYWNEGDQGRALRGARAECGQPYTIARGPNGGIMLHAPDAVQTSEMTIITAAGKRFMVPFGTNDPNNRAAREIISAEGNTFVTRYVDPAAHSRYGYKVYARCGGR